MFPLRAVYSSASACVAALLFGVTPRDMGAQVFEGAITMRLSTTGRGGPASQDLEYLSRSGNVRVSLMSPGGPVTILHLSADTKTYMMMESQKVYMDVPVRDLAASAIAQTSNAKLTRSGRRETIAGYACEHLVIEATNDRGVQRTDVCVTEAITGFVNPMAALGAGLVPAWQRLTADAGFPLRVTMPDGSVAMEVTKIEKRRVRDDVFRIPADFTKMDMPKRP